MVSGVRGVRNGGYGVADSDVWQVAELSGHIESISHDKPVGDMKAAVVCMDWNGSWDHFFQEDAGFDAEWIEVDEVLKDGGEGLPGVENVLHHQNVACTGGTGQTFGPGEGSGLS